MSKEIFEIVIVCLFEQGEFEACEELLAAYKRLFYPLRAVKSTKQPIHKI